MNSEKADSFPFFFSLWGDWKRPPYLTLDAVVLRNGRGHFVGHRVVIRYLAVV